MGENSQEFLRNFENESQNCDPPKNLSSWAPILGIFSRISEESVTGNDSREILPKFFKEYHNGWRIWGNSSLLLPGMNEAKYVTYYSKVRNNCNLRFMSFYITWIS